jgi:DNA-binding MarR family transcriptional regulator
VTTSGDHDVAAWRALLLAQNAVLKAIEADLAAAGQIPLTWYDVLLELNATPQRRLRIQQLASRVVLSRTRVSRLVDELVTAGLVERLRDPADGRASFASITGHGRAALRKAAPVYLAGIKRYFTRHLSQREQETLTAGLGKVIGALQPPLTPSPRR